MEEAVIHASKVAALQTLPVFMEKDDRHYHVSCTCPLNALVAVQGRVSKPVCTIHLPVMNMFKSTMKRLLENMLIEYGFAEPKPIQ